MRKPDFLCGNKGADQLRSWYNSSTSEFSSLLCVCTVLFLSDLVGNPEDMYSNDATAQKSKCII